MPKQISPHEYDAILSTVELFPEGASLEQITLELKPLLSRRTLQRRLAELVRNNYLFADGRTSGSRYRLPFIDFIKSGRLVLREDAGEIIPLSPTSQSIQMRISKPLQTRHHVNYHRKFLDKYRPNVTYYLPPQIRQHLFEIGKTPMGERPSGTYARQILSRLLIDLSWNSSRLEGNTYSLLETKRLIELGEMAEGKKTMEAQMILNHKAAIEFLVESAEIVGFNRYSILSLHALLSNNLLSDPHACGRLRSIPVGIGQSVYHPPAVPQVIDECFQQILDTASVITNPFEQAFFVMVHLPYLQPFEDVNKRVSRLAANLPLIRQNLCPLSFVDVPDQSYINGLLAVYELNRIELMREIFIWAYERSCMLYTATRQELGEPDPFRLRYRHLIMDAVTNIVRGCLDPPSTLAMLKKAQEALPPEDQARFIEVVEIEVKCLHEGNIARYRLLPSEYEAWHRK